MRWRAQDEEGAVLRDQLRQAAQLWEQHGRSEDFLWTGTAYREYRLWRERYPGGLTAGEEVFAAAMEALASRRRRRARTAAAGTIAFLVIVIAVVVTLWLQSERSRKHAEEASLRAEASKLLALGQLELETYPTAALAYATKSLELADQPESRVFAIRALQRSPPLKLLVQEQTNGRLAMSPDGKWLALGTEREVLLFPATGGDPVRLPAFRRAAAARPVTLAISPDSRLLFAHQSGETRAFAIPSGAPVWTDALPSAPSGIALGGNRLFISTLEDGRMTLRTLSMGGADPEILGSFETPERLALDPPGWKLAFSRGAKLFVRPTFDWEEQPRLVGDYPSEIVGLAWHPDAERIAVLEASGAITISDLRGSSEGSARFADIGATSVAFSPGGRWLASRGARDGRLVIKLREMGRLGVAEPLVLQQSGDFRSYDLAFSPDDSWLVVSQMNGIAFWPLRPTQPFVLSGHETAVTDLAFRPDGSSLYSAARGRDVREWPLSAGSSRSRRSLLPGVGGLWYPKLALDAAGKRLAVGTGGPEVLLVDLENGSTRGLQGFRESRISSVAFSPDGQLLAAAPQFGPATEKVVQVWDLESRDRRALPLGESEGEGWSGAVGDLEFASDGRVLATVIVPRRGGGFLCELLLVDVSSGSRRRIPSLFEGAQSAGCGGGLFPAGDGQDVVLVATDESEAVSQLAIVDLETQSSRIMRSHGTRVLSVAADPGRGIVVTGGFDGMVRVGPMGGGEPHLLSGHARDSRVNKVAVSPDGKWVASGGDDQTIRLWPMPDLSEPPLHTLPLPELLARLRSFTNLRVVEDGTTSTGYRVDAGAFPGWAEAPPW